MYQLNNTSNNNQENILFFYLKWESVFHYYTIVPSLYRNQNGYIAETYWFMVILPKGFLFK